MVPKRQRWGLWGAAVAVAAVTVAALASADPAPRSSPSAAPSGSPARQVELVKVGGVFAAIPDREIRDPTLMPYPFMAPTPPPVASAFDGTYLRTLSLRDVGGARIGLPYRCLRCPPFRIDAGVSTLVLARGAYYLHHHLSGFKTLGSYTVEGDRITFFNDANCPQTPGTYRVTETRHGLWFDVIEDDCPYSGERSFDLMRTSWTRVSACVRRIGNLWPGEIAC